MAATDQMQELALLHQATVMKSPDPVGTAPSFADRPDQTVVVKRPWIDPPSGSEPFDEQDVQPLPAAPAVGPPTSANETAVVSFQVPIGSDGVINAVSNLFLGGGWGNGSGEITWRIQLDGKPVRNFEAIKVTKGSLEQGRIISPIRIYSGQLVEYIVTHVSNVALVGDVVCSLTGYYYPSRGQS